MPLKDYYPVIDDRTYDDIVDEARSRIPRYTPEWTDLNESDPGMTLIELFSWLTEMQLYRLSKVPELNYIKFLELIGLELEPAKPARGRVTFPVKQGYGEPYVIIPARTRISTAKPDEKGPIVFETDEALVALTARLNALQSHDGFAFIDLSADNEEAAAGFEPFGDRPKIDSAFYLGFAYSGDFPEINLSLSFWTDTKGKSTDRASCADAGTGFPPAEFRWEYWNGKEWRVLGLLKDDTNRFTRSGFVYLKTPAKGLMKRSVVGKIAEERYWVRARLAKVDYDAAPSLLAVRSNTVAATQAETISNEVVGGSSGRPEQVFKLSHKPVLKDTLRLQLDEGQGFVEWREVPDFFGSGRDDMDYVLNRSTGEIRFGGAEQHIPVANPNRVNNILAAEYRVGGGRRGNVSAGSVTTPLSSLAGVDNAKVGNLFEFAGGSEEESMSQAKARAPQSIKSRERAVTAEDYELLALRSANIARAKALPLFHPDFPEISVPGVVSVVIVPDSEGEAPSPGEATLKTVCAYLNERRLLTVELYVLKPVYREVTVSAELIVEDDADPAAVREQADKSIRNYFHPLYGGERSGLDGGGDGWPFGGDIYYSKIYSRLLLKGVKRIAGLTVALDGTVYPACADIAIGGADLLFSGEHDIRTGYDYED
ncbi:MAG: putative baseplate assembly protein [Gammaproteobacteria bacterium]